MDAGAACQLPIMYVLSKPHVAGDDLALPPVRKHRGSGVRILTNMDISGGTFHNNNMCIMFVLQVYVKENSEKQKTIRLWNLFTHLQEPFLVRLDSLAFFSVCDIL